ncbi:response regulator [Nakamurella sp.]|uniref:response regulator n=1 Tax=Nakamurella sp. TaxID=1869182 RepID=UPI003B3A32B8
MRVVLGEDEALMRQGLILVLDHGGIEVVGQAGNAPDLVRIVAELAPDLVISDIRMPPDHTDDGLRAALAVRAHRPGQPVLLLSHHVHREYTRDLLRDGAGGIGYLLKHRVADLADFLADLHRVAAGGTVLDPEVVAALVARARRTGPAVDALTARQREVLTLLAQGRSNAAIARRLGIAEKTVVQHVSVIYDQFGLLAGPDDHRRVLAVLNYLSL